MGLSGRAELQRLIRDLGSLPPDLRKELRPALRKAAHPVLMEMRSNASWSTRIPPATRIATSLASASGAGVTLKVSSGPAPHARPYEHGGAAGNFRHPVFGNKKNWVPQRARPFFYRAVDDKANEVRDALGDTVVEVAARHGF
jgi:hypothetical protein